jgi:hypothetical protein
MLHHRAEQGQGHGGRAEDHKKDGLAGYELPERILREAYEDDAQENDAPVGKAYREGQKSGHKQGKGEIGHRVSADSNFIEICPW